MATKSLISLVALFLGFIASLKSEVQFEDS